MTAHRHELRQPWAAGVKVIVFPIGVVLLAVYLTGWAVCILIDSAIAFPRWIADQFYEDDGVGGPAIDDDEFEDDSWPR